MEDVYRSSIFSVGKLDTNLEEHKQQFKSQKHGESGFYHVH